MTDPVGRPAVEGGDPGEDGAQASRLKTIDSKLTFFSESP